MQVEVEVEHSVMDIVQGQEVMVEVVRVVPMPKMVLLELII